MPVTDSTIDFLKKVPLFAGLSDADLQTVCEAVQSVRLSTGELLFSEGEPGDRAYVVREGQLEVFKTAAGRETTLSSRGPGDVIGEMAIIESAPRMASVRARSDAELLAIGKKDFDRLIATSHDATRAIFNAVLSRWRSTEAVLRHSERMAQLGTLTAGVAHEMNNPAAAVKRGADQLSQALEEYASAARSLASASLDESKLKSVVALERQAGKFAPSPRSSPTRGEEEATRVDLDPLERSDRESALEGWLAARGVEAAWELAPALVELGLEPQLFDTDLADLDPMQTAAVVRYVAASRTAQALAREIGMEAGRLSEIVKALKSYSYLDQAPVQNVDIQEGIENTLVILSHKLKQGIQVKREFARNLPKVEAYGSELNQVWTNLIDNAIDAMAGRAGELTVRTYRERDGIAVEVEDNGAGIPPEVKPKIFDAFFTTKPPGKGTGLGLNVSYNIVVHRHRGSIEAESRPGKTTFKVWLPGRLKA
ncbi:MAG: cyclic nucleotide-binding domain-containing protein [Chloroflexi bacterium]|nr:cyclic nucleotide-binding domain-containing protein [Chloroflexota bacterium]